MNKKIGVVIVNYNGGEYQNDCIKCILKQSYQNFLIIVVDNNSSDDSMLNLIENDRIIKIFNDDNLGVTEGNNIGIRKSIEMGCEYTLLLNNDTLFSNFLFEKLVEKTNEYDVVAPKILYHNSGKLWYGGGYFSKIRCSTKHYNFQVEAKECKFLNEYDYSPTCCMLLKNKVFDIVGLMDNDYFLYYDDSDFCARLYKNNIKIGFVENVNFEHLVSMSAGTNSKTSIYYMTRNKLVFMKKNKSLFCPFFRFMNKCVIVLRKYKMFLLNDPNLYWYKLALIDYKKKKYGRCGKL